MLFFCFIWFLQGCIKLIKSDSKKLCYSKNVCINAVLLNSFIHGNLHKICITVSTNILNSKTLIVTINVSWAANQHIIMIFEGSCDTED